MRFFYLVNLETGVILDVSAASKFANASVPLTSPLCHVYSVSLGIVELWLKHLYFSCSVIAWDVALLALLRSFIEDLSLQRWLFHCYNSLLLHFFVVNVWVYLSQMSILKVGIYRNRLIIVRRQRLSVNYQAFRCWAVILYQASLLRLIQQTNS